MEIPELDKVDLIKINAEGYELQILKGAEKTLRKFKPSLIAGVHHYENEIEEVIDYLSEIGDKKYKIDIKQGTLTAIPYYKLGEQNDMDPLEYIIFKC